MVVVPKWRREMSGECVGYRGISSTFAAAPEFDFVKDKSALERLNVSVMNTEVDNRLVNFMNNSRADARVLSSIITNRQKFPAEKFEGVKNAFPVIIANIRQFGEYKRQSAASKVTRPYSGRGRYRQYRRRWR